MFSYTFRVTPKQKTLLSIKQINTLLAHKQNRIKKLLLMREGGGKTETHYHGIIKTNYKRQTVRNFIKSLCKPELENAEYAVKDKAIEHQDNPKHAYNYVCKEGNIYISIGYPKELIKKYQHDYKDQKDKALKKIELKKKDKMKVIIEKCKTLPQDRNWERAAIRVILTVYNDRDLMPPVGYQLEKLIGRILMSIDLDTYIKHIQLNYKEMGFYAKHSEYIGHNKYCINCGSHHDVLESCS